MNILVIGGCHVSNYGVPPHLGFVQQWATYLKLSSAEPVYVNRLSMVKLDHIPSLLSQYESQLTEADLIVLQLGNLELCWRKRFSEFFQSPTDRVHPSIYRRARAEAMVATINPSTLLRIARREQMKNKLKIAALSLHRWLWAEIPYLNGFRDTLMKAFEQLAPYQDKIIVLTPFPTLNKLDQWLRRVCNPFIVETAKLAGFRVADTFRAVPPQPNFFLPDDVHLNSLGHLLVATYLSELPLPATQATESFVEQRAAILK